MTTEGWPDDRLTSSDVPSLVRFHAGPADDPDRFELLGEADGADEAWHVLDHRAATGEALFTLAALRPAAVGDLEVVHHHHGNADDDTDGHAGGSLEEPTPPEVLWRERAAGLARVRHARLAGIVDTFVGPAPHRPGQAEPADGAWHYAVLEQAAGRSVADWLRDDPGATVEERFTVLATAASVLQELHRGSEDAPPLVHGDITPRSVRLGGFWPADGVRLAGASLGGLRRGPVQQRSATVYTAPEVRAGALPSAAGDVFGFGATAVFVLTGMPPATSPEGDVDPALVRRQLAAAALTAPHPGVADLLLQALAADPAQRPDRLPAWVNGMRAIVEPRTSLDPYQDSGRDEQVPDTQVVPYAPARVARSLPKRPVAVVVGALLLATAGTAVAITAVQQGRLRDVPNPVAIVQPPPQTSTGAPTSSVPQAPATSAPSSADDSAGDSADAPEQRVPSAGGSASSSEPSSAGTADGTLPVPVPTEPGTPLGTVPGTAPGMSLPDVRPAPPSAEVPTASAPPPVTGPDVLVPPGIRTPTAEPTPEPTPTPTDSVPSPDPTTSAPSPEPTTEPTTEPTSESPTPSSSGDTATNSPSDSTSAVPSSSSSSSSNPVWVGGFTPPADDSGSATP
ncbi:serine/threonine-protein kinase [Kineococcus sp. SYSU DK003]|uniref:hypothetical protein n=1 Tax=Kineococcus sp. SYSU DK003 TaxID=3383124 RepID=UPI003D7DFA1D